MNAAMHGQIGALAKTNFLDAQREYIDVLRRLKLEDLVRSSNLFHLSGHDVYEVERLIKQGEFRNEVQF